MNALYDEILERLDKSRISLSPQSPLQDRKLVLEKLFESIHRDYPDRLASNFDSIGKFFLQQCNYDVNTLIGFLKNDDKTLYDIEMKKREDAEGFDKIYGTRTSLIFEHFEMNETVSIDRLMNSSRFVPSPVKTFRFCLQQLAQYGMKYEGYTFIDIGVGLGRNLLIASEFPFKQLIGVEISEKLVHMAKQNIAQYNKVSEKKCVAEFLLGDALEYRPPAGPLVIYFWEPFGFDIQAKFVKAMERHFSDSGEKSYLVFLGKAFPSVIKSDCFKLLGIRESNEYMGTGIQFRITYFETLAAESDAGRRELIV